MKNLMEFKGQKYIIMMLISIALCCITVFASEKALEENATLSGSQQEVVVETQDEMSKLLEELTALKEEVAEMKQELNNVKQLNSNTYIAQKDVNVFAETSSYSELMGTFKSGSVIRINTISEDSGWAETDQGYVKLMFLTQLEETKQEALFTKAEPKVEEVKKEEVVVTTVAPKTTEYRIGVTGKSGLSKEDLDYLLAGSRMADCSDEVLAIEEQYNVNGFFTISVAQAETERGKTGTGKSKNNAFGITDPKKGGYRYFNNLGGSVEEFGGMMHRVYISKGRDTVSKVHAVYTDSPNWSSNVNAIMNKELAKIKAK